MAIFPKAAAQFGKVAGDFKGLGSNIGNAFGALKNSLTNGSGFIGRAADTATSTTVWAARAPVRMVKATYGAFPKLSAAATVVGGAVVANNLIRGAAEKRTQGELEAQYNQPTGPVSANAYQVSPEEYAAMQARMRQGGQGQGFAAAEEARRAAAAQQQTTPAV